MRRDAILAVGGFDERWGVHAGSRLYAEETEAAFRLARGGFGRSRYCGRGRRRATGSRPTG